MMLVSVLRVEVESVLLFLEVEAFSDSAFQAKRRGESGYARGAVQRRNLRQQEASRQRTTLPGTAQRLSGGDQSAALSIP